MTLVLARVDDRLVHGQVTEAWAPCLHAETLLVVDDEVWRDAHRRRLLECLAFTGVEVLVVPLTGLAEALAAREGKRVIALFSSLQAAAEAVEGGLALKSLNVGNLHHPGCACRQVAPSIFLDDRDLSLVERLRGLGVRVEGRDVPEGKAIDLAGAAGRANPRA